MPTLIQSTSPNNSGDESLNLDQHVGLFHAERVLRIARGQGLTVPVSDDGDDNEHDLDAPLWVAGAVESYRVEPLELMRRSLRREAARHGFEAAKTAL
jgi:hypothetical protein